MNVTALINTISGGCLVIDMLPGYIIIECYHSQ